MHRSHGASVPKTEAVAVPWLRYMPTTEAMAVLCNVHVRICRFEAKRRNQFDFFMEVTFRGRFLFYCE